MYKETWFLLTLAKIKIQYYFTVMFGVLHYLLISIQLIILISYSMLKYERLS